MLHIQFGRCTLHMRLQRKWACGCSWDSQSMASTFSAAKKASCASNLVSDPMHCTACTFWLHEEFVNRRCTERFPVPTLCLFIYFCLSSWLGAIWTWTPNCMPLLVLFCLPQRSVHGQVINTHLEVIHFFNKTKQAKKKKKSSLRPSVAK